MMHEVVAGTSDTADERASATVVYRVRFDECGTRGAARAGAILRWAQDVAWIHSERLGYDRRWYEERGLAWVVRAIQLVVLAPTAPADELSVSTRVTGFRRVWARRRTELYASDGRLAACAWTDWVMTDGRGPARVPAEFEAGFVAPAVPFEPTRVPLTEPPADAARLAFVVRPADLDPYGHVNHAAYADWIDEAADACAAGEAGDVRGGRAARAGEAPPKADPGVLPPGAALTSPSTDVPRRYRIEYLLPTPPAVRLVARTWRESGGFSCALQDDAGRMHLRARLEPGANDLLGGRPTRSD